MTLAKMEIALLFARIEELEEQLAAQPGVQADRAYADPSYLELEGTTFNPYKGYPK